MKVEQRHWSVMGRAKRTTREKVALWQNLRMQRTESDRHDKKAGRDAEERKRKARRTEKSSMGRQRRRNRKLGPWRRERRNVFPTIHLLPRSHCSHQQNPPGSAAALAPRCAWDPILAGDEEERLTGGVREGLPSRQEEEGRRDALAPAAYWLLTS